MSGYVLTPLKCQFAPKKGEVVTLVDGRTATVQSVGISPYYAEEITGIERVYVFGGEKGKSWTDYVLLTEIL